MGNENLKSRRGFLSFGLGKDKPEESEDPMVKMLTADGQVVEVRRSILEKICSKKASSNKEIFDWMQNPSKEKE